MSTHSTFGSTGPAGPAPGGLPGARYVSDGGLETDLIFHHGVDLPEFASFPLIDTVEGRALLRGYFTGYAGIARRAGVGLTLETPTWRANPDWGARMGYDAAGLDRANRACVALLQQVRGEQADLPDVRITGVVGPRGDGYVAGEVPDAGDAAAYHRPQVAALAEAGVDVVASFTFTTVEESLGVVRAARQVGVPVLVGFTVETDGRLPDGTPLGEAVRRTDAADAPDGYLLNCAHPTHVTPALDAGGDWLARVVQLNPNASTQTHVELDEAEALDAGDLDLLVRSCAELVPALPALRVLGGCCGTDTSHVAALWDV